MSMGVVYYRSRVAGPKRNGTETEWKCTGGVQVIERQTAELAFHFDRTERNRNITVFMPPTVDPVCTYLFSCSDKEMQ